MSNVNIDISEQIPVDDPAKALNFCRKLAVLLKENDLQSDSSKREIPDISVVIPLMNEEGGVLELLSRLANTLKEIGCNYEIILVDDGSTDSTTALIKREIAKNNRIVLVELARNFGHQFAISAGLDFARGKAVIVMDGDLQDPPELIPTLYKKWNEGFDVVYGIRESRQDALWKKCCYVVFYRVLRLVATIPIPLDSGDFCIIGRNVVDQLKLIPERNRFLRGLRSWVGFRQIGLPYAREARFADSPKYNLDQLVHLALDGLISFSFRPLRAITMVGLAVSLASILLAIFYIYKRVSIGLTPPGFATTIVAILFLAGMQLVTMGLIGEYVGRIFEEVKRRPLYIVKEIHRGAK